MNEPEAHLTVSHRGSVRRRCQWAIALGLLVTLTVFGCDSNENTSPVIQSIQLSTTGQIRTGQAGVLISAIVLDPDGDDLTYSWTATGGTIRVGTSNNSSVVWDAPAEPGVYTIGLSVSDGTVVVQDELSISIEQPNSPPTLAWVQGKQQWDTNEVGSFEVRAADPDNDTVTFSWVIPAGTILEDHGSRIVWQAPTVSQDLLVRVVASDGTTETEAIVGVSVREAPAAPSMELHNNSSRPIVALYWSDCAATVWGGNRISGNPISAGSSRLFTLPGPGCYDFQATDDQGVARQLMGQQAVSGAVVTFIIPGGPGTDEDRILGAWVLESIFDQTGDRTTTVGARYSSILLTTSSGSSFALQLVPRTGSESTIRGTFNIVPPSLTLRANVGGQTVPLNFEYSFISETQVSLRSDATTAVLLSNLLGTPLQGNTTLTFRRT